MIRLTIIGTDRPMYLTPRNIACVYPDDEARTCVVTVEDINPAVVKETPEQVMRLIQRVNNCKAGYLPIFYYIDERGEPAERQVL